MSKWFEITDKEELSMSDDGTEIHICFDDDYSGAIYVSVPTEMIKELLEKHK